MSAGLNDGSRDSLYGIRKYPHLRAGSFARVLFPAEEACLGGKSSSKCTYRLAHSFIIYPIYFRFCRPRGLLTPFFEHRARLFSSPTKDTQKREKNWQTYGQEGVCKMCPSGGGHCAKKSTSPSPSAWRAKIFAGHSSSSSEAGKIRPRIWQRTQKLRRVVCRE